MKTRAITSENFKILLVVCSVNYKLQCKLTHARSYFPSRLVNDLSHENSSN